MGNKEQKAISWGRRVRVAGLAAALSAATTYAGFHYGEASQMAQSVLTWKSQGPFLHRPLSYLTIVGLRRITGGFLAPEQADILFYFLAGAALYYLYYFFLADYFTDRTPLYATGWLAGAFWTAWTMPPLNFCYPHDVTGAIFFIGLAHALLRRRWWLWYPLLALGLCNRETVILLLPALVLILRGRRWEAIRHGALSTGTVIATLALLHGLLPANAFVWYLDRNLEVLFFGSRGLFPYLALAATYLGAWLFAPWGLRELPGELRIMLVVWLGGIAAMFLFGIVNEIRVWNEYAVFVIPAAVLGLRRGLRRRPQT